MGKKDSTLIAIGGGDIGEEILTAFLGLVKKKADPRIVVMTVATNEPDSAARKYNSLFRSNGINHVDVIDISQRDDAFDKNHIKKVENADALFFTGGDQMNVTSLLGGSPLHQLIRQRIEDGFIIVGTSAGATMMSNSMIITGNSDSAPKMGAVEIAPGMDLLPETMVDTHFSQRGRHGRLLTAIAHYPQDIGIGIDERTAIMVHGNEFKVLGEGAVTVMDAGRMTHNNLPFKRDNEPLGMFNVNVHVLSSGYKYNFKTREPIAPTFKAMAGVSNEE